MISRTHVALAPRRLVSASLGLLLLVALVCLSSTLPASATTTHNPPWADNYDNSYSDGTYTNDAAEPPRARQAALGYLATRWHNSTAGSVYNMMQNDAVWSMYAHANNKQMYTGDGSSISNTGVKALNLSGMKVAVFYGCDTAQGSDHITQAAVTAGAGASIGFYDLVYLSGGATSGPAYSWSNYFWLSMGSGNNVNTAAYYARDYMYRQFGNYMGTDKFSTWGNGAQTISPAGYK